MGIDNCTVMNLPLRCRSYADTIPAKPIRIHLDCSLGINPYGFPDVVDDIVHSFDVNRLYQYPHSDEAKGKQWPALARLRLHRAEMSL